MKQERLGYVTIIVLSGFLVSVVACYIAGIYLGYQYPYNTFLYGPTDRFNDFFNVITSWSQYLPEEPSPNRSYFPFSYALINVFMFIKNKWISFGFFLMLFSVFVAIYFWRNCRVASATDSIKITIILSCMSFPILFLIDRANFEAVLFIFLCLFIEFYKKEKFFISSLFLSLTIAMKAYPAVFLVMFLSDRKYKEIFYCLTSTIVVSVIPLFFFNGTIMENLSRMLINMGLYTKAYAIDDWGLDFGCSLFGVMKVLNKHCGPFMDVASMLHWYTYAVLVLFILIALYVIIYETVLWRKFFILLAAGLLFPHVSADYKLIHIFIALFLFLNAQKEKHDTLYLTIFGLLLIPKNIRFIDELYGGVFIDPILIVSMVLVMICGRLSEEKNHAHLIRGRFRDHIEKIRSIFKVNNSPTPTSAIFENKFPKLFWSYLLSSAICLAAELLIYFLYNPDVTQIVAKAREVSLFNEFSPEPKEKLQFYFSVVSIPIVFIIIYHRIKDYSGKLFTLSFINRFSMTGAAITALALILFYQKMNIYSAGLLLAFFLLYCFYLSYNYIIKSNRQFLTKIKIPEIYVWGFCVAYVAITLYAIIRSSIYSFSMHQYHFNAVIYSIMQVSHGKAMLLDGLSNTYGLYSQFLGVLFAFVPLTVKSISIVFMIQIVLVFVFFMIFLYRMTENKFFAFLGAVGIFFAYIYWKIKSNDIYYQYLPLRMLFPAMMLMTAAWITDSVKAYQYIVLYLLFAVGILWVTDQGILVYATWTAFCIYRESIDHHHEIITISLKHIALSLLSLSAVVAVYMACIRYFYGAYPHVESIFNIIIMFSHYGYFLLPMPAIHYWNIYMILAMGLLCYSVYSYFYSGREGKSDILFLLSLTALGGMVYYQGRSHHYTFSNIIPYLVLMGTITGDRLWKYRDLILPKACCGIFTALYLFCLLANTYFLYGYFINNNRIYQNTETIPQESEDDILFIKRYVKREEPVVLWLNDYQAFYHIQTETMSAIDPGIIDMFYKQDLRGTRDTINNTLPKIFINKNDHTLDDILNDKYQLINCNKNMCYYKNK